MKTVALILALAVITGCNGRALRQPVANPNQWEATVNRFWQYISDLNAKADGVLENLKASQLSRELDTLITDSMAELTSYIDNFQTKLSEQTSSSQQAQDLQLLANKLEKDMMDAKDRVTNYMGELTTMVELNTDDVRGRIGTYATKLKKRLDKDTEEIRNTVAAYAEELQSRTSQNLETIRGHVEPYVNQASDGATKKMTDISTSLQTQAEVLGKELMTQTDVFKTQLEATAEELRVFLEAKIDELKEMFVPMATQIREQFETIIDQAKEATAL